jgi:hypothetical protein
VTVKLNNRLKLMPIIHLPSFYHNKDQRKFRNQNMSLPFISENKKNNKDRSKKCKISKKH